MPLGTVCVSIVSNRPRNWSSYSNISSNDVLKMHSAEEITTYKDLPFYSPSLQRRTLGCSYDFPEKSQKKDKKWSISNIFRRKKKDDSESSSEDDPQKKNFLSKKKKKPEGKRKKPSRQTVPFDHVVIPPGSRNSLSYNGFNNNEVDSTNGFSNYLGRTPQPQDSTLKQSITYSNSNVDSGSVDSLRKNWKGQTKARAEARRNNSKHGSSSEDESHRSDFSLKIGSDDNLQIADRQLNKKSRTARTERYLKRHSRDGENPHNYLRLSKSDVENWKYSDESNRSLSRSPLIPRTGTPVDKYIGLTIPPSHNNNDKYRVSNSTSNPSYKPPQSMNDYNSSIMRKFNADKYFTDHRSYSCDDNIHKTPDIMHVSLPIKKPTRGYRNLSLNDSNIRYPPPPPPRDPNRCFPSNHFENTRPNTFYLDNTDDVKLRSLYRQRPLRNNAFSIHPNYRSTSEDQLAQKTNNVPLQIRPSSATPELHKPQTSINDGKLKLDEFNYLTDKNPRSRKPIYIKPGNKIVNKDTNKALNFWKEIDRQSNNNSQQIDRPPTISTQQKTTPQMFASHSYVQTKLFVPNNSNSSQPKEEITNSDIINQDEKKRKSSNLEEALHELEAIYNSLRLGDEDLLDRAEQKEKEEQSRKNQDLTDNCPRLALSDSSFSYEPYDAVPRRKRHSKKSKVDIVADDMAFRKLNKHRSNTIGDPQSVISQISYLSRSPIFSRHQQTVNDNEPNIDLDDVAYRNVAYSNNLLKVIEPQPPFGIPIGPITPGANSDYLHAKPENLYKPSFKHKKIPDIVKDDLAFRNLRKDSNKGPALPPVSVEDYSTNPEANLKYFKTKRAQRSMSANIGHILTNNDNGDVENTFKTLTDIADAMDIARKVLREKENKITATKKAFMSDTDASYIHTGPNPTDKERTNFLNELRTAQCNKSTLSTKPPRGLTPERRRSPKESTPIPISPLEDKTDKTSINSESTTSSLDDLLNALAVEAKETTERITRELKLLNETKENENKVSQNVVDSTKLITALEEEVAKQIDITPAVTESATLVMSRFEKDESEHDYENLSDCDEIKSEDVLRMNLSPFEEHKAELIASFQDLKTAINLDVNDDVKDEDESVTGEEECSEIVALPSKECAFANNINSIASSKCDLLESSVSSCEGNNSTLESLESLKSPKLVLETSNKVLPKSSNFINKSNKNFAKDFEENLPGPSQRRRDVTSRVDNHDRHFLGDNKKRSWYQDPSVMAFACSYGVACAHQLASFDLFAVLSILFAVLSFIAAYFL